MASYGFSDAYQYLTGNKDNDDVMGALGAMIRQAIADDNESDENVGRFVTAVLEHFFDPNNASAVNAALDMFSAVVGWDMEDLAFRIREEQEITRYDVIFHERPKPTDWY